MTFRAPYSRFNPKILNLTDIIIPLSLSKPAITLGAFHYAAGNPHDKPQPEGSCERCE
jgi:hypothetical protein